MTSTQGAARTAGISVALAVLAAVFLISGARAARADTTDPASELAPAQVRAAERFAGHDGLYAPRGLLVEHHRTGKLERIVLLLGRRTDGATVLADPTGRLYTGGLDDFRAHNHLLTPDDTMVTYRDITAVAPHETVTVSGHTRPDRTPWTVAGISAGAAVLLGGAVLLVRRARRARGGAQGEETAADGGAAAH
ncbi:hypothetical protein [Streptomyces sp. NBC_01497]|uniref:hypothetical protein n=1 Tax=Streptomyces sp. NBC_01497 TaxID=2903885 RepID=UPI002E36F965|nr:hypothetical protein [Streptomyces sp. NBC_01497]